MVFNVRCQVCGELMPQATPRGDDYMWLCVDCADEHSDRYMERGTAAIETGEQQYHGGRFHAGEW
jgi:hypothetical protein